MTERKWVKTIIKELELSLRKFNDNIRVNDGLRLPYSSEIIEYIEGEPNRDKLHFIGYQTDILISEKIEDKTWKPRVIIEAKINKVSTHDAITYSQKAQTHKTVHPYLRYGILIGNRKHYPLPGRLFRHGQHFDFMQSWTSFDHTEKEWAELLGILDSEIWASKDLEEIIFNSRSPSRKKFTSLHKPLRLEK